MKRIPELSFKSRLPDHLRYDFMVEMDKKSMDRIQIISWLAVVMYSSLFYLDYKRLSNPQYQSEPIYTILFYLHLSGLLYLIPALATTFAKQQVRKTRISRGITIWFTLLLMTLNLLGQSYFSYQLYYSLSLFMIYVLVANWTFTMNHNQRITFNLGCFVIMIVALFLAKDVPELRKMVSIYEGFFFIVIAFLFGTFDYNLRQAKYLEEQELAREKKRIEELEMTKSRMYTNLTHEIRTPLTVIAGMSGQIASNPSKWTSKGTELISRNTSRILNLVNQILDLSKLESGTLPLHLVSGDVVTYLRYVIDSFHSFAESKNIRLHFLADSPVLVMDYDPEKTLTIVSNLLSNAIKFTPAGGDVYVRAAKIESTTGPRAELRIKDTGVGIPEDKLHLIFERFYQISDNDSGGEAGTGVGLAIVKEIVKLMEGNITVSSKVGHGTEFILDFPIEHNMEVEPAEYAPASIKSLVSTWFEPTPPEVDKFSALPAPEWLRETTRILVIEDNADVVSYIAAALNGEYILHVESNGPKGLEKAIGEVPDLVISDLMMPGMDGYEVCKAIKQDVRTSHIPVLILTARADRDSKITGIQTGADAYMTKPFDKEELLAQIKQLIDSRKRLQAHYNSQNNQADTTDPQIVKEDIFIKKVREAILARIDDSSFGIMALCRALGMSRTQLHNKLKALTGKSASHVIRSVRLSEAQKLLKESDLTIAEVAYTTGFNDPGYFSRIYREEYGESPSEYRV